MPPSVRLPDGLGPASTPGEAAEEFYREAMQAFRNGDYPGAKGLLHMATECALIGAAQVYIRTNR